MLARYYYCSYHSIRRTQTLLRHLSKTTNDKLAATAKWLETIVVHQKLCPFAAPLLNTDKLRIVDVGDMKSENIVQTVINEAESLLSQSTPHETTLLVLDENKTTHSYRDFVRLSWTLQEQAFDPDNIQLVLFHPRATHQTYGSGCDSAADYTIRSPYPTLHLLRQCDLLEAVQSKYPGLEYLPVRNAAKLQAIGLDNCRRRLDACYETDGGDTNSNTNTVNTDRKIRNE